MVQSVSAYLSYQQLRKFIICKLGSSSKYGEIFNLLRKKTVQASNLGNNGMTFICRPKMAQDKRTICCSEWNF